MRRERSSFAMRRRYLKARNRKARSSGTLNLSLVGFRHMWGAAAPHLLSRTCASIVARRFSESPPSRAFTRKKRDIKSRVLTTIFIAAPSPAHNRYSRSRRTRAPRASTIYPITPMWALVSFPASHHGTLSAHKRDLPPPVHSPGIRRSRQPLHIPCPPIITVFPAFHAPSSGPPVARTI